MIFVALEDFDEGFLTIATNNFSEEDLEAYVDRYEQYYLAKLLGADLAQTLIDDVGSQTTENQVLLDEWFANDEDDCDKLYHSRGLKEVLLACIFFHFIFNQDSQSAQAGTVKAISETSNNTSAPGHARRRYNACLETVDAIRWKCLTDAPDDYPDFKGQIFEPSTAGLF